MTPSLEIARARWQSESMHTHPPNYLYSLLKNRINIFTFFTPMWPTCTNNNREKFKYLQDFSLTPFQSSLQIAQSPSETMKSVESLLTSTNPAFPRSRKKQTSTILAKLEAYPSMKNQSCVFLKSQLQR